MTAILRIVEDGELKYEAALRGLKRIGGITFYELDLADIPDIPARLPITDKKSLAARLNQLDNERRNQAAGGDQRDQPNPDDTP